MTAMPPDIETARLRLRQWREDDWRSLSVFFAESEATNIMGGVSDAGFAWRVIACHVGHWQWRGYGMYAVADRETDDLVGFCGPWYPADWPEIELGWSLLADYRGKGLATEAAAAADGGLRHPHALAAREPDRAGQYPVDRRRRTPRLCPRRRNNTPERQARPRLAPPRPGGAAMTCALPTLETERLILRQWRRNDFEPLRAFLANGEANRYRGIGKAATTPEAWRFLCEKIGEWHLRGTGEFALEAKASGNLIGWAGLWHPIELEEPELAWSLFPAAQGNGYATEAAARVMRWAAHDLGLPPLFSFVHPDNHPSRRLAERLGATLTGETTLRGQPRLLYRHRDLNAETSTQTTTKPIRRETVCPS